jgi:hypothetical protein
MLLVYSITSSKTIEKKNHGKRAKFDGEIAVTELDPDMAGRYRNPVKDSYECMLIVKPCACTLQVRRLVGTLGCVGCANSETQRSESKL